MQLLCLSIFLSVPILKPEIVSELVMLNKNQVSLRKYNELLISFMKINEKEGGKD